MSRGLQHQRGLTLLELLVSVAILSLILGFGVPGMFSFYKKQQAEVAIDKLFRIYQAAREYAVENHTTVHICGSNSGNTCDKRFSQFIYVFVDEDNNNAPDPTELIFFDHIDIGDAEIKMRIAFGRKYTRINDRGAADFTGSMVYCPEHAEHAWFANRLTWNRAGRAYEGIDRDGDGRIDDTNGKPLSC